jgi:hypothetical protein
MSSRIEAEERAGWFRFDCPACGGWLAVPDEAPRGNRAERMARRIDAFVHRHGLLDRGGAT